MHSTGPFAVLTMNTTVWKKLVECKHIVRVITYNKCFLSLFFLIKKVTQKIKDNPNRSARLSGHRHPLLRDGFLFLSELFFVYSSQVVHSTTKIHLRVSGGAGPHGCAERSCRA